MYRYTISETGTTDYGKREKNKFRNDIQKENHTENIYPKPVDAN